MEQFILKYRVEFALAVIFLVTGLMLAYSGLFTTNTFDWSEIRRGPVEILEGKNPYAPSQEEYHGTFNPPHLLVVGQPWILASINIWVLMMVGSVGLLAIVVQRPVMGLYILTASFLIGNLASGNIGLQSGVLGMVLLWLAQNRQGWLQSILIGWAYGLLTVKPQMSAAIVPLHFLWLYFQRRDLPELSRIVVASLLIIFIVPSVIALATGAAFEGELRLIWWEWVDGVFFRDYDRVNVDTDSDFGPFINRFGAVGAFLLTLLVIWIIVRRVNPNFKGNIKAWEWSAMGLAEVFQLGASLMVIWTPYTDTSIVGLAWMLTMRWTQIVVYLIIVWWLAIWIWPIEFQENIVFIPIQAFYLIPVLLSFAGEMGWENAHPMNIMHTNQSDSNGNSG